MKFVAGGGELDGNDLPDQNEQTLAPGGIVGFSLNFFQTTNGC